MTQKIDKKTPVDRLAYTGDLQPVVERLSAAYSVGSPKDFSVIGIGYEDCNVIVETQNGKFVAKIFQKDRKPEDILRYTTIMEKAIEAGVNHPPLLETRSGKTIYKDDQTTGLNLVLMKFIEGKTFFDIDRTPTDEERNAVLEEAVKINAIDHHPAYIIDSWAIPNIRAMYDRVKKFIKPEDLRPVEQVMAQYQEVPVAKLPHCFVHGDFTKTNVIKGDDGRVYILDFSVANWYPRIQELAVIAANLLYDEKSDSSLRTRTEIVSYEYSRLSMLSPEERKYLYPYSLAGVAMEFMGSHQEKYINGNDTQETEYWLNLGREGLRKALL